MQLRPILISLIIFYCTATDIYANEMACLTLPLSPLPQGDGTSIDISVFPPPLTGGEEVAHGFSPEPYFEEARSQYKDGNLQDALEKFRFLADNRLDLNNPGIAGTSLFMTGHIMEELRLDGAVSYLEQVISVYPILGDYALYRSAESVARQGSPAEAAKLFKRIYDSYPESRLQKKALLRASKNHLAAGITKEARADLMTFLDLYPGDAAVPDVLYNIGMSYLQEGKDSSARNYFNKIWINHPVSREARLVKMMIHLPLTAEDTYRRGTSFYDAGYYEEAIDEYKRFLSRKKGGSKTKRKDAIFKIGMSHAKLRMLSGAEENLKLFLTKHPNDEKAPEALYWLGRNYLRQGNEDAFIASSIRFLKQYKKDEKYPEVMYRLGNIFAERNEIDKAFLYLDRVIREFPFNGYASDSLWKKGWILYKTGDHDGAVKIFNKIIDDPGKHAYYEAQAIYWRAKVNGKNGNYAAMDKDICGLCSDYGQSFYCLFSRYYYEGTCSATENTHSHPFDFYQNRPSPESERENAAVGWAMPTEKTGDGEHCSPYTECSWGSAGKSPEAQGLTRIRLFLYLGLKDDAIAEVLRLRNRIHDDKETSIMLASILSSLGEYNRAMYTIRPYIPSSFRSDNVDDSDDRLWPLIYPAGYSDLITKYAVRNNLDPFLVHAIIREESWFNKEAVSPAGALGLMQLMPGTAKLVAKESYAGRESLFDPEVNIELGTRFFAERLKQFDGNIFLAIASYNAGPEAVEKWMNELDGVELDEFIEDIPYKETREYVKKVFRSYMEYHRLYKEDIHEYNHKDTMIDTL